MDEEIEEIDQNRQGVLALVAMDDAEAMNELQRSLMPLVDHIVEQRIDAFAPDIDVMQRQQLRESLIAKSWQAIPQAIQLFREQQAYRFGSFFSWAAKYAIGEYLRSQG